MLAEGIPGGFSILYDALSQLETLGVCRRGYFVEGLGGAQFALPGAVERLRAQRDVEESAPLVLAATDPAQPYGAALPWPRATRRARASPRACAAPTSCSPAPSPCSTSRRAAAGSRRSSTTATRASSRRSRRSPQFVTGGRGRKLSLERVDGEPVVGSPLESLLIEVGFRAGPSKLTLSA